MTHDNKCWKCGKTQEKGEIFYSTSDQNGPGDITGKAVCAECLKGMQRPESD